MWAELAVAFLSGSVVGLAFALWVVAARARLFRIVFWGAVLVVMVGGWFIWSGSLGPVPAGRAPAGVEEAARPR